MFPRIQCSNVSGSSSTSWIITVEACDCRLLYWKITFVSFFRPVAGLINGV